MRIDKFLWYTRYYKTRSEATEACRKNRVCVNGFGAKASREVVSTDRISLRKEQMTQTITVLDIPASRVGAKLVDVYRKDETPAETYKQLEILKQAKEQHRKAGEGRPTKKDRRDMEDFGKGYETDN